MNYKKMKFEPAVLMKRRDNLASSDYSNVKPFMPSYNNRCEKPNLFYLLSMEYQRMWMEEKLFYVKGVVTENVELLRRGYATKHEHKIPRYTVPDRPQKQTTKYDHIRSKFKNANNYRRHPCLDFQKSQPTANYRTICTYYINR